MVTVARMGKMTIVVMPAVGIRGEAVISRPVMLPAAMVAHIAMPRPVRTVLTEAMDMDDFVAMANLKVNGTQIYRKKGADEAFTDNIFLKAAASGGRTAFIECDAVDNWMDNVDLGRVLKAASLPQTVKWGGKTWKADEVQVYDADVFDDLKPIKGGITGLAGFQGEDRDMLLLQGNLPAGAAIAEKDVDREGARKDADKGKEAVHGGPIFVRYEEDRR